MFMLKSQHRAILDKATADMTASCFQLAVENRDLKRQVDDLTKRLAKTTLRAMNAEKKNQPAQKRLTKGGAK